MASSPATFRQLRMQQIKDQQIRQNKKGISPCLSTGPFTPSSCTYKTSPALKAAQSPQRQPTPSRTRRYEKKKTLSPITTTHDGLRYDNTSTGYKSDGNNQKEDRNQNTNSSAKREKYSHPPPKDSCNNNNTQPNPKVKKENADPLSDNPLYRGNYCVKSKENKVVASSQTKGDYTVKQQQQHHQLPPHPKKSNLNTITGDMSSNTVTPISSFDDDNSSFASSPSLSSNNTNGSYYVAPTSNAPGTLYADRDMEPGEPLCTVMVIVVPAEQYCRSMRHTDLAYYLYQCPDGDRVLALGDGSLFAQSRRPNVEYKIDKENFRMSFFVGSYPVKTGTRLSVKLNRPRTLF